jgi:hypothetical protein
MTGSERFAINHLDSPRSSTASAHRQAHFGEPFPPQKPQNQNQQRQYQEDSKSLFNHAFYFPGN